MIKKDNTIEVQSGGFVLSNGFPDEYYGFTGGELSATVERNGGINVIYLSKWIKAFSFLILGMALMMALGCKCLPETKSTICLAEKGMPLMKVVLNSADAIPAEKTAARELTTYLEKITGAKFEVIEEKDLPKDVSAIYLGVTKYAGAQGIDFSKLSSEESILRTVGKNLILAGGRPRGTLYAVFELLEMMGVRWYTPWEEKVPKMAELSIPKVDKQWHPDYLYRENGCSLGDERMFADHKAWIRFVVHNRLNGQTWQGEEWGEAISRGRAGNHSFAVLLPADKYFKEHPEYFSERQGKRVPGDGCNGNHLCLTNPDVLRTVIEEVRKDIQKYPKATYISVSINDGGSATICDCAKCRAVAAEEGESGLLLQFVNQVADAVKSELGPNKYILTLAYNPTYRPPKRIKARDNVVVFMCGGRTSLVHFPLGTASAMQIFADWSPYAMHVWVWDYANSINRGMHFFKPMVWQMDEQFKFFQQLGVVDGLFQENEFLGCNDIMFTQFFEMNMWIFGKLCQNPGQDMNVLIDDFLNGYYGRAAKPLRTYHDLLHARRALYPYRMFDYEFAAKAQEIFDEAEMAVAGSGKLLERIKDLRLNLDMAMLAWRNDIVRDYIRKGKTVESYPFKISVLKTRIMERLAKTEHPYIKGRTVRYKDDGKPIFEPVIDGLRKYLEVLGSGKEYTELPEQFRFLPSDRVIDLTGANFAVNSSYGPVIAADPEAAIGLAYRRDGTNELPFKVGVMSVAYHPFQANEITGKGYRWYQGPRVKMKQEMTLFLTNSNQFQEPLRWLYNPADPDVEWDIYVSAKFTGPAYPFGELNEPNALFIDRLILVKVESTKPVANGKK